MTTFKQNVVFLGLVLMFLFAGIYGYNYQHEKAHLVIAQFTGGNNCTATVSPFGYGETNCDDYGNMELQMLNEIVGYNMFSSALMIFFGLILVCFIQMNKGD